MFYLLIAVFNQFGEQTLMGFTPFNYYNSRTTVTNGVIIPKITINELRNDEYFKNLPIVRKNFQGVNGVKFSAKDYMELQRILSPKDLILHVFLNFISLILKLI
jgi:hypothetical protein